MGINEIKISPKYRENVWKHYSCYDINPYANSKTYTGGFIMLKKGSLAVIVAAIMFAAISSIAYAAPKAAIDEYVFNAGDRPQGKAIIHDFIIKNTGDMPLEIKVKPC